MEIRDGVFPAIADCRPGSTPSAQILRYCSLALGLGLRNHEAAWDPMRPDNLTSSPMEIFLNSITARPATSAEGLGLRSWFKDAGLLVCRPAPGGPVALGAAFKGGHNDEHHNHNDVGSFSVALGGRMPVGDPGGPYVYNAKTFSGERYTALKLFGLFLASGAAVDGKDQKPGRKAAARVLDTSFADASDRIVFDLAAAYDVPGLVKLERAFVLNRGDSPSIGVRDTFAAGRPVASRPPSPPGRPEEDLPGGARVHPRRPRPALRHRHGGGGVRDHLREDRGGLHPL
ncbi:MAG: hypothetical protein U1F77_06970 [Kiritimatiellia bacterium]